MKHPEAYGKVFSTLLQFKSLPFLEIAALCSIDDGELQEILTDMEKRKMIRVANPRNAFEQVVTLRERAYTA